MQVELVRTAGFNMNLCNFVAFALIALHENWSDCHSEAERRQEAARQQAVQVKQLQVCALTGLKQKREQALETGKTGEQG